ncbi:ATP-binding protein [Mycolicibacterium rutilum]|uniref:ATP-binding protein n=1 Tax=Mycolicibacterium rutilum TaxID=370526 RepID=UPI0013902227|nr:AAA family ATPase [Mycolicibacterium rutilum]
MHDRLDRHRQQAAQGQGSTVLLRGEAGAGKTAVIAEFLAKQPGDTKVLQGWCDPLSTPRPLGPLIDMLTGVAPEHAVDLRAGVDAGDVEAVHAAVTAVLASGPTWVCVVEDVHWADGATLDLLRYLAGRIESLPVLLVVSYRDDEVGDRHPLAVLLNELAAADHVAVEPLSEAAVAELSAGSGVHPAELHRLTGGNPFYVTEVLAAGPAALRDGPLPPSVYDAVWGRLARLSMAGRQTAYAAAIFGPRIDVAVLRAVCPAAVDGLPACLETGVLVADTATVHFRHELARRATYEQIPAFERRSLHRRVLDALAEYSDPNMLNLLAFHADQARDSEAVIRYGPDAAARASALAAYAEAAELFALTLRHADAVPDHRRVEWVEQHALNSNLAGHGEAAAGSFRQAADMRRALGDRLREGDNLRWLSYWLWAMGRTTEALEVGRESVRLLEDLGPSRELAWALVNLTELAAVGYDPQCPDYSARAVRLGEQLGDRAVAVRARCHGTLSTVTRTGTGWEVLESVWREAMGDDLGPEHAGIIGVVLCWNAAHHHRLDDADRYIRTSSAFCREHDLRVFETLTTATASLTALHRGDWVNAASAAEDVLTKPALSPLHRYLPLVTLALTRARRDDARVSDLLDEAVAISEPHDVYRLGLVWAARAEAAWLAGDDATARAEALGGLAVCTEHTDPWRVGQLQRWVRLAGGEHGIAPSTDVITPYRHELQGDYAAAAAEWTRLGCPTTRRWPNSAVTPTRSRPRCRRSPTWAHLQRPAAPSSGSPSSAAAPTGATRPPSPTPAG